MNIHVKLYMWLFDEFAANTKDVMEGMGLKRPEALKLLNELEAAGLIVGEFTDGQGTFFGGDKKTARKRTAFQNKLWQCYNTYDYDTKEQALARVSEKFKEGA